MNEQHKHIVPVAAAVHFFGVFKFFLARLIDSHGLDLSLVLLFKTALVLEEIDTYSNYLPNYSHLQTVPRFLHFG